MVSKRGVDENGGWSWGLTHQTHDTQQRRHGRSNRAKAALENSNSLVQASRPGSVLYSNVPQIRCVTKWTSDITTTVHQGRLLGSYTLPRGAHQPRLARVLKKQAQLQREEAR